MDFSRNAQQFSTDLLPLHNQTVKCILALVRVLPVGSYPALLLWEERVRGEVKTSSPPKIGRGRGGLKIPSLALGRRGARGEVPIPSSPLVGEEVRGVPIGKLVEERGC